MRRLTSPAPAWRGYVTAAACSAMVLLVVTTLPWAVPRPGIVLLSLVAVMVSAFLSGFGAALVGTGVSVLGITYFLLPPLNSFHIQARSDIVLLGIFASAAFAAAWFIDWSKQVEIPD